MKNTFKKISIVDFVANHKKEFKRFKNTEKLKIVREIEERRKEDKKYFLCINQNGHEVVKSDFMLNYDYTKLANGSFIARYHKNVLALQVKSNIEFSNSYGERTKLFEGDYVVLENEIIIGMKKVLFEENYKSVYKANKMLKSYKEEGLVL